MESAGTKNPVLHHVNLKTSRLQEMIDWYRTVVGTEPLNQFDGGSWSSNDEANHRIALITSPEVTDDPDKVTIPSSEDDLGLFLIHALMDEVQSLNQGRTLVLGKDLSRRFDE